MLGPARSRLLPALAGVLILGLSASRAAVPSKLSDPSTRGRELYGRLCAPCHGPTGLGDGPLAANLAPAGLALRFDGPAPWPGLEAAVREGRGAMPAFKGRLSPTEQRLVLRWLQQVQAGERSPAPAPTEVEPPGVDADGIGAE